MCYIPIIILGIDFVMEYLMRKIVAAKLNMKGFPKYSLMKIFAGNKYNFRYSCIIFTALHICNYLITSI